MTPLHKLTTTSYQLLAAFRYEMRKFLAFSEQAARDAGIEPQQHQLLLALRGLPNGARPTIGAVAERLCVQHHTAVALVDKLEQRGLVSRERGTNDRRQVLLHLTPDGEAILLRLSTLHRQQLLVVGPAMVGALQALVGNGEPSPKPGPLSLRTRSPRRRTPAGVDEPLDPGESNNPLGSPRKRKKTVRAG